MENRCEVLWKFFGNLCVVKGGNAGLAASYAGTLLKKPVHVFVPKSTPEFVKKQFDLYQGVQLQVHGNVWDEANAKAEEFCKTVNAVFVHPYNHPYIWLEDVLIP